jgi:hypothetical protein
MSFKITKIKGLANNNKYKTLDKRQQAYIKKRIKKLFNQINVRASIK